MKTHTKDCNGKVDSVRKRKCVTCELGEFCRNHYYRGKLLTERDFSREQQYFMDKARLHNVALHGWGVVCGLKVKPHPHCPELRVIVEPGLAVDDCGREVRVTREAQVPLPEAPPKKAEEPCPEEPKPGYDREPGQDHGQNHEHDHNHNHDHNHDYKSGQQYGGGKPGQYPEYPEPSEPPSYDPCDDRPVAKDLYLCIRYAECESEFQPAPFDDCGCSTDGQQPNRICEGFEIDLFEEKPDWWDKALQVECSLPDCEEIFRRGHRACPELNRYPCLPLAVIRNVEPGKPVGKDQIENWPRRVVSSAATLEQVIRCILEKLPTKELTRIIDINWQHGERVLCHQFMSEFVGSHQNPRGFEIRFDSKVYAHSIDTRSFQAMVIFRPEDSSEPRVMELAPAYVEHDNYETEWCRLRIDPGYARRRLDGRNFDLFITLKCNVITGKNGLAVDGDFLATREHDDVWRMALPTGDSVAGGAFESWIRVRPRPKGPEESRRSAS